MTSEAAPTDPVVRLSTAADREAVLTTVVAAFAQDPAFRWFFPHPERFDAEAAVFVDAVLGPRLGTGGVWVADNGRAVAMWERPDAAGQNPGNEEPGNQDLEHAVPPDTYARLLQWERAAHTLIPDDPHWYLGILATHPSAAGQGLAKLAAAPGLAEAAAAGLTAWLETASPANVTMYRRRGWVVAGAVDVDGVTCTVMHRP